MRKSLCAALLVLVLPACGTTVDQTSAGGGQTSGSGDGLSVPVQPDGSTATGPGATTATSGPAAVDPSAGPGSVGTGTDPGGAGQVPGSAPAPGTGPAPGTPGAPAVGITSDTIFLGAGYANDTGATNTALGASGATPDARKYYDAVINEVNARGGVLGRKLKGVYKEFRATSSQSFDEQYQAGCEHWFTDNKVFVVAAASDVVYECTAKAGAVAYGGGGTGPVFARNPHLVAPTTFRLERGSAATVHAMVRMKWHVPEPAWPTGKIGVITWDDPDYKYAYEHGLKKALTSHGLAVAEARFIKVPQNVNGLSDSSVAVHNAVLRFHDQKVDHVFIQDGAAGVFKGAGLTLLFTHDAESQRYYPRYGFNGNNAPGNAAIPARQQRGMLAIQDNDYSPSMDAGIPLNRARERCFAVMRKAGLDVTEDANQVQAASACDYVWFMEHVLRRAGVPTREAFLRAVDGLGTSFAPSFTYGTRMHAGRRDGADLVRTARFDDACICLIYTSKPFAP